MKHILALLANSAGGVVHALLGSRDVTVSPSCWRASGMTTVRTIAARLYLPMLISVGLISLQPWQLPTVVEPVSLGVLTVMFGFAEFFMIRFRGGATNLSFPMAFAAFHLYGTLAGVWVAGIGAFSATAARRRPVRASLLNLGFCAVAASAAGWCTEAVGRISLPGPQVWPDVWNDLASLLVYSQVFFWSNVLLLDGLIWLRHGRPALPQWLANLRLQLTALGISSGYCVLFLLSHAPDNPLQLLFLFLPLFLIGFMWQASHDLRRSQERHAFLYDMASHLTTPHSLGVAAYGVLDQLRQVIPYDHAALLLRQSPAPGPRGETLQVAAFQTRGVQGQGTALRVKEGPIRRVLDSGRAERIDDLRREKEWVPPRQIEAVKACLLVPVVINHEVRGLIGLGSDISHAFFPEDLQLLTVLSNQLSVVIQNLEILSQRERLAVAEERTRLARDFHDGLAQQLAGVVLRLEHLSLGGVSLPAEVSAEVQQAREEARRALREIRRCIYDLRPVPLQETSFVPALRRLANDLGRDRQVEVSFEVIGEPTRLKPEIEDALFQIATEALNNILKHSKASRVQLDLRFSPQAVRLIVQDNGIGFELLPALQGAKPGERVGIIGMHERVKALDGRFVIDSKPGNGTRVDVIISVRQHGQRSQGVG